MLFLLVYDIFCCEYFHHLFPLKIVAVKKIDRFQILPVSKKNYFA